EYCVSVGRRLCRSAHTDIAVSPAYVLDVELLAKMLGQLLCDESAEKIGRTAWRIRHDHAHRPRRIGVRPCQARAGRQRSSTRSKLQKISAGKFHEPPSRFISLDHLVGAGEERRWHSNAKRIGGFHIDDQLETSWLLDRQIGGLGAFEDFVDVHGSLVKKV